MADATPDDAPADAAPKSMKKKLIVFGGAGVGALVILGAIGTFLVMKVEKVHSLWCGRIGLLCKAPPPTVVVKLVVPGNCPGPKMKGTIRGREASDIDQTILADTLGRISLDRGGWVASGKSDVSCAKGEFLATFDGMSQKITYQCLGSVDGKTYAGVCTMSQGGPADIAGTFE